MHEGCSLILLNATSLPTVEVFFSNLASFLVKFPLNLQIFVPHTFLLSEVDQKKLQSTLPETGIRFSKLDSSKGLNWALLENTRPWVIGFDAGLSVPLSELMKIYMSVAQDSQPGILLGHRFLDGSKLYSPLNAGDRLQRELFKDWIKETQIDPFADCFAISKSAATEVAPNLPAHAQVIYLVEVLRSRGLSLNSFPVHVWPHLRPSKTTLSIFWDWLCYKLRRPS